MKYIIDADPGADDTLALTIGLNELDVLLITTMGGNVALNYTTQNALDIVHYFKKQIPVCMGSETSLTGTKFVSENWLFGNNGICDYKLPPSPIQAIKNDVADEMYKTIISSPEKVTIIAIAPLTNIAKLLQKYPEVKNNIEEILIMGGAINGCGNINEFAEYNFFSDSPAAGLVLESKVNIRLFPMNLALSVGLSQCDFEELGKHNGETAKMISNITCSAWENFNKVFLTNSSKSFGVDDVFVMLYLTYPFLYKFKKATVTICSDEKKVERGQTFCSFDNAEDSHIQVAYDIEKAKAKELLINLFKKYK